MAIKKESSKETMGVHVKHTDLNAYFIFGAILLVFLAGIYAIFSPNAQAPRGNPACGKIVIASDGATLRGNVAPTLQEAMYFLVVDPLSGKMIEAVKNPYRGPQPSAQIAYLIAGKGEEAVIVGNIDQQSYNILMQFGIRTFGGYTGQAKRVIQLYKQARISQQTPTPDTIPQPTLTSPTGAAPIQQVDPNAGGQVAFGTPVQQAQPAQPAGWGVPPMYQGPVYPNALPLMQGGGLRYQAPIQNQMAPAALMGLPDGDTMRRTNPTSQVAFGGTCPLPAQPAAMAQLQPNGQVQDVYGPSSQYPASQYPQINPNLPLAAAFAQPMQQAQPQGQNGITWELAAQMQQQAQQAAAIAQQQAALAQQAAAMAPQQQLQPPANVANNPLWERAAMVQQPPANVANNPMWERAAIAQPMQQAQPQGQNGITWELAAQMQQQAQQAAAIAQQQAALAQQAAAMAPQQQLQPPANVANNPMWERAALAPQYGLYGGGMAPAAAQMPIMNAPAILSTARMPHAARGNCTNCHQIIDAGTANQNAQAAAATNQMMWNNMAQDQNSVNAGVGRRVVR